MKNILISGFFVYLVVGFNMGCKKDTTYTPVKNTPVVSLSFTVDNIPFRFDTILYTNAAGNNYSISRLNFYLSAFEFENAAGMIYYFNDVIYVDAKNNLNSVGNFSTLPAGNYKRIKFLIGLDSIHNIENALPPTVDNDNMTWPSTMGGGYHFLKLEGNFVDASQTFGYAMHLGRNKNCVTVNLAKDFYISSESNQLMLTMNINEWFQNPHTYDFNVDGNYSMSDSAAMAKLSQNGFDVFKLN